MPGVQHTAQWRPVCSHGNRETVAFLSAFLQETSCCQRCLKLALESKAVRISSSDTMQRALWPSRSQHGVCHTLSPIPVLYPDGTPSLLGLSRGVSGSCKSTFNACCFCTHTLFQDSEGRAWTQISSGGRCTEMPSRLLCKLETSSDGDAQFPGQVPGPSVPRHRLPSQALEDLLEAGSIRN